MPGLILLIFSAEGLRQQCGDTAGTVRKDCGDAAETVRKDYGVVTMRKDCRGAAETVRKDYGSSADIVRTQCGTWAVPLRTRRRSALLSGCSLVPSRHRHARARDESIQVSLPVPESSMRGRFRRKREKLRMSDPIGQFRVMRASNVLED